MLLAELALLGEGGRAPLVRQEARVAVSAPTTSCHRNPRAFDLEVGEHVAVGAANDGPDRHWDNEILAVAPVPFPATAVGTPFGASVRVIAKRKERRQTGGRF